MPSWLVTDWPDSSCLAMPTMINQTERTYNEALRKRLRAARETAGLTQDQMSTALSVDIHRYRKYELRSPLPPFLFEKVSIITGADINYLLTGKRPSPVRVVRARKIA